MKKWLLVCFFPILLYSVEISGENVPQEIQKKAEEIEKLLSSWKSMTPSKIEFSYQNKTLQINVIPSRFEYEGRDLLRYLKGGLQFFYRDTLEYDFRIFVDKMFLRLKGFFTDEDAFCKNLLSAIKDPRAYLRSRDPEFMLKRIEKIEQDLGELTQKHFQLQKNYDKLKAAFDKARLAMIALHNTGFFSGPSKVSEKIIKRVVALKKAEPSLTVDQISEKLEASSKEIELILAAFFYELED